MVRRVALAAVVISVVLLVGWLGPAPGTAWHAIDDAAFIVISNVLLALAGLWVARKLVAHQMLEPHNNVTGFVYATIGVINAVVLGFVVVTVWQQYETAQDRADHEAHTVMELYRLAPGLPPAERTTVQQALIAYAHTVVNEEWPAMARGQAPGINGEELFQSIWEAHQRAASDPSTNAVLYASSVQSLSDLGTLRRERLLGSQKGLPGILWGILLLGGALTVGFAYGFGVGDGRAHAVMIIGLAASVALLLFVVWEFNTPYRGDVRVRPIWFESVLERLAEDANATRASPGVAPLRLGVTEHQTGVLAAETE